MRGWMEGGRERGGLALRSFSPRGHEIQCIDPANVPAQVFLYTYFGRSRAQYIEKQTAIYFERIMAMPVTVGSATADSAVQMLIEK